MPVAASLDAAREVVAVARFLAAESAFDFDQVDTDSKLLLLGVATEIVKFRAWHEEVEGFYEPANEERL